MDPEQRQGELASLYVRSSHENQGIGRKLIQFVENRAREVGVRQLLALSTQAFTYFQSKGGFTEGTPDDLPPVLKDTIARLDHMIEEASDEAEKSRATRALAHLYKLLQSQETSAGRAR